MDHTRALSSDKTSAVTGIGLPNAGSLQISSSALRFDQTSPGEESFLTLRITPPQPNALVVVSVDDASLFQVAAGIERLAFKQALTFKPEPTGSYIHLRYTPERSGRHQATLTVEVPATAEALSVQLTGRTAGLSLPGSSLSLPAATGTRRPMNALTKSLLIGGLLLGIGYAGYTYRCQIWPATCGPSVSASTPVDNEAPTPASAVQPESRPVAPGKEPVVRSAPTRTTTPERTQPTGSVARRTTEEAVKPEARADRPKATPSPDPQVVVVPQPNETIKSKPAPDNTPSTQPATTKPVATQRTQPVVVAPARKPVQTPKPSEESELERALNREPN